MDEEGTTEEATKEDGDEEGTKEEEDDAGAEEDAEEADAGVEVEAEGGREEVLVSLDVLVLDCVELGAGPEEVVLCCACEEEADDGGGAEEEEGGTLELGAVELLDAGGVVCRGVDDELGGELLEEDDCVGLAVVVPLP